MVGVAFMAKNLGGLVQASLTIGGVTAGPLLGVFIMGIFCPRVGAKQAGAGLLLSWVTFFKS